jgi:tetratricopeptide (TPR) repeat protein/DNA-binding winged helix-turn-helix (wHTH) protein/TolB-like protein
MRSNERTGKFQGNLAESGQKTLMEGSGQRAYRFDEVELYPLQGRLVRAGQETHLRQKSFQVLTYLVQHRDRLITKAELLDKLWSDTAVTEGALTKCIIDIRHKLGDDAHQPKFIKNIPRVGYRFIHPVEELSLNGPAEALSVVMEETTSVEIEYTESIPAQTPLAAPQAVAALPARTGFFSTTRRKLVAALVLLMVAAVAVYSGRRLMTSNVTAPETVLPQVAGKKSVVVMFFDNQSNSQELDWLRGGLADMLISSLTRAENLTVLSRQQLYLSLQKTRRSSMDEFQLKDAFDLAQRMKIDTVVSGSFAKLGEKIRIDVRLHDPHSSTIIAAESLTAEQPHLILEQVDLLGLKLARHLGLPNNNQVADQKLASVMTNNLEAYRYYSLAVEMTQAYHSLEAIELLNKAIALDPEFALAHARIGYTYAVIHNNEGEKAKPHLEKAFQLSHRLTEKDHLWIATWYALAHEDIERARRSLRQIINQYPLEVEAYFRLGTYVTSLEEKISVLKQGLAVDPAAHDIWNDLGLAYCYAGRYEEAFAAFKRYIELAPEEANAYDSLGMCYNEAGRFDEALREFKRALELNPRFHLTHIHVGDSYLHQGRYRKALEQYRHVLEVAPSNWDRAFAHNRLVTLYLKKGDLKQAEAAARNELRLKNDMGGSFLVALALGRLAEADRLKTAFLAHSPEFRPLSGWAQYRAYFLGRYALKAGHTDEALEYFKQLAQEPRQVWNDRWPDALAQAYLELERWDEAISEYERLIALNPNYALLHYNLGKAYEQKGQRERARVAYERFLQIWKEADADIPEVVAAKEQLAAQS